MRRARGRRRRGRCRSAARRRSPRSRTARSRSRASTRSSDPATPGSPPPRRSSRPTARSTSMPARARSSSARIAAAPTGSRPTCSRRPSTIRPRARFSSRRGARLPRPSRPRSRTPDAGHRRGARAPSRATAPSSSRARGARRSISSIASRRSTSSAIAPPMSRSFAAAGTIFVGSWSAQAAGDYCTGSNHVLPTGGAARFRGGLSTADFVRVVHRADAHPPRPPCDRTRRRRARRRRRIDDARRVGGERGSDELCQKPPHVDRVCDCTSTRTPPAARRPCSRRCDRSDAKTSVSYPDYAGITDGDGTVLRRRPRLGATDQRPRRRTARRGAVGGEQLSDSSQSRPLVRPGSRDLTGPGPAFARRGQAPDTIARSRRHLTDASSARPLRAIGSIRTSPGPGPAFAKRGQARIWSTVRRRTGI